MLKYAEALSANVENIVENLRKPTEIDRYVDIIRLSEEKTSQVVFRTEASYSQEGHAVGDTLNRMLSLTEAHPSCAISCSR